MYYELCKINYDGETVIAFQSKSAESAASITYLW